ncbi:MAG: type I restriction enzyme HsdR N-terminal domain-containing protein [Prolixibacteraceae bacterium]|jgi:Type I restriction enzyme R protein N terminus (HSDR_N)
MQLNLPTYTFRTAQKEGRRLIFDAYRRRWVRLTPEEWVRQHFVKYLIEEKHFPASLMAIEKSLRMNQQDFRTDAVVFSTSGIPLLIIECKAPEVKITQKTFDQIIRYNFELQVDYLIVTNGLSHFCCRIDKLAGSYEFLKELPDFREINQ